MDYPYIITEKALTIFIKERQRVVHAENKNFDKIKEAVRQKDFDKALLLIDASERVNVFGKGKIAVKDGSIYYLEQILDNVICDKILKMIDEGFDVQPMISFLENLMDNPSHRAVKELYLFMEHGRLPITPDGHFLAYKKVKDDFKDYYTSTFDHTPGQQPTMLRNMVDDNRDNTCSSGLHFCSLEYLRHYYGSQGKVIIVKINPRDVVSIPSDYNNTKGRACTYLVLGEYTGPETEHAFDTTVFDPENDSWNEEEELDEGDSWGNSWEQDAEEEDDVDLAILPTVTAPVLDGGTFKNPKELLEESGNHKSNAKPDHPDKERDGVPRAVKELVGQVRLDGDTTYEVTSVAGPRRGPKGYYTGKWHLYIKDTNTNVESVKDMEDILKDEIFFPAMSQRNGQHVDPNQVSGIKIAADSLTQDILDLAEKHQKFLDDKKED